MVIILNSNSFFKPTPLYNEFMILDLIEKDSNITQREISKAINIAVSMVNNYLNEYEEEGLIIRKKSLARLWSILLLLRVKKEERSLILII